MALVRAANGRRVAAHAMPCGAHHSNQLTGQLAQKEISSLTRTTVLLRVFVFHPASFLSFFSLHFSFLLSSPSLFLSWIELTLRASTSERVAIERTLLVLVGSSGRRGGGWREGVIRGCSWGGRARSMPGSHVRVSLSLSPSSPLSLSSFPLPTRLRLYITNTHTRKTYNSTNVSPIERRATKSHEETVLEREGQR